MLTVSAALVFCLTLAPSAAFGAVAFVGASSAGNGAGATTLVINKPAGVVQGHLMLATTTATGSGAITAPSGWTVVQDTTQGTAIRQISYYKVASASESASYSWSLGTSRAASGGIVDYSGANQTVPIDSSAGAAGTGSATIPSVTTSAAGDKVVVAVSFGTSTTVTSDASTTERYDINSTATTNEAADFTQVTAGATGAKTATPAKSAAWVAQTVALRDASTAALSVSTTAAPSFSANLNSGDQSNTYTVPLNLNDTRTGASAGLGWNTTVTSTQFLSGSRTLATNASTITAVTSACSNGGVCTTPTNAITYPLAVPAGSTPPTAVKFYNAGATTGTGTFTLTPTVSVTVPQNSYAGTYTSTLTISVVSGP